MTTLCACGMYRTEGITVFEGYSRPVVAVDITPLPMPYPLPGWFIGNLESVNGKMEKQIDAHEHHRRRAPHR